MPARSGPVVPVVRVRVTVLTRPVRATPRTNVIAGLCHARSAYCCASSPSRATRRTASSWVCGMVHPANQPVVGVEALGRRIDVAGELHGLHRRELGLALLAPAREVADQRRRRLRVGVHPTLAGQRAVLSGIGAGHAPGPAGNGARDLTLGEQGRGGGGRRHRRRGVGGALPGDARDPFARRLQRGPHPVRVRDRNPLTTSVAVTSAAPASAWVRRLAAPARRMIVARCHRWSAQCSVSCSRVGRISVAGTPRSSTNFTRASSSRRSASSNGSPISRARSCAGAAESSASNRALREVTGSLWSASRVARSSGSSLRSRWKIRAVCRRCAWVARGGAPTTPGRRAAAASASGATLR